MTPEVKDWASELHTLRDKTLEDSSTPAGSTA